MTTRILLLLLAAFAWLEPAHAQTAAPAAPAASSPVDLRIWELREKLKAAREGNERYALYTSIARELDRASRPSEAMTVIVELTGDESILPGRRSIASSDVALQLALRGDTPRSRAAIAAAKRLAAQATEAELEALDGDPRYRFHHAEAEIARRVENQHEVALAKMLELSAIAASDALNEKLSEKRRRAATNEWQNNAQFTTLLMVQNNRAQEALAFINDVIQRSETVPQLKASTRQLGSMYTGLAIALSSHDNYEAALDAVNTSIALLERSGATASSLDLGIARRNRLMVALALGTIAQYTEDARLLQLGRSQNPALAGAFAEEEADSLRMAAAGEWKAAHVRMQTSIDSTVRRQGSDGPFPKYRSAMAMMYELGDPSTPVSEASIERYVGGLAGGDAEWGDARFRGSYLEDAALSESVLALLRVPQPGASSVALAFRTSEYMRMTASQGALAQGAARLAASNPALRALIEQEQLLRIERTANRRTLSASSDRAERLAKQDELVGRRQLADVEEKRKALEASESKLRALRQQIAAQFPLYRELISPPLPTPAQLGAALRPGEAYLALYAGSRNSAAFLVLPDGSIQARSLPLTRVQARKLVSTLRKPFDAGQVPERPGDLAGFDVGAAHELYRALIAPLATALDRTHTIYVAAGGALGNVPWPALLTQPATGLSDAKWWGARAAVVQIPSASSLMLTRKPKAAPGTRAFLAFADPSFDGKDVATTSTRRIRQRAASGPDTSPEFDYRSVPRLPETLDEALQVAKALGGTPEDVVHGAAATRTRVLKEDLSRARVLAFATHGLVPGEIRGVMKTGLAMAYEGRGLDDSLLTVDEIVGLRLNADWVVLSACNTGFSTGNSGDAFAALVRGFFAAGARTVAATLWQVESESARELMVATFRALATDPALTKAGALSAAQRGMMEGRNGELYRHPYFWSAYFIAGDASR